ncbi:hypothetical protein [Streptomyces bicolor]|uniref:hypothetical protein n=1 Tax=Streptomyces bicolor TaxID=66874 RepID=UPI0004E16DDE|nr:hypothetical protein [Streptomyces bicolor]
MKDCLGFEVRVARLARAARDAAGGGRRNDSSTHRSSAIADAGGPRRGMTPKGPAEGVAHDRAADLSQ